MQLAFLVLAIAATANAVNICTTEYTNADCTGTVIDNVCTTYRGAGSCSSSTYILGKKITCSGYFPGVATVALKSGESKRMSE